MTPQQLQRLRYKWGLTQTELAEKLGVTQEAVKTWELGLRPILPRTELALKAIELEMKPNTPAAKK